MKNITRLFLLFSVSLMVMSSCSKMGGYNKYTLKTTIDSVSYIIGTDIGKDFKSRGMEASPEAMAKGISDAMTEGKELVIPEKDKMRIIMAFQGEMQKKMEAEKVKKSDENKKKAATFLADNRKKDGIKVTPSGLQYKVVVEGKGNSPKEYDTIVVHYKGKLIDGTEFDNSYSRQQPAKQPLSNFIPGWKEGIMLMKKGGKIELFIPPDLGYGDQGAGEVIPGGAVLLFEVELLDIIPGNPAAKTKPAK
jgi:FKBP-type peptidyl-prolyl cis-trans isomerase FklB